MKSVVQDMRTLTVLDLAVVVASDLGGCNKHHMTVNILTYLAPLNHMITGTSHDV